MKYNEDAFVEARGRRIKRVEGLKSGSDRVVIVFENDSTLTFEHQQDCCEHVALEDVEGSDAADYVGAQVAGIYEEDNEGEQKSEYDERWQWTFYRIITSQGTLVLRWYGSSNGYYSTSVSVTFDV